MKRILFIVLLFAFVALQAQESKPIIIQSSAFALMNYDDAKDDWGEWTEWIELESPIIVKFYTKDNLITINNKAEDRFKVIDAGKVTEGTDSEGDNYKSFRFNAIDKEGNFLDVRFKWHDSGTIHVYCEYPTQVYVYDGVDISF